MIVLPSPLDDLPTTARFTFEFMELFRRTLERDKQQLMMEMAYFGFSSARYNKWLVEAYPVSPSIRATRNRQFAQLHDLFIQHLEKHSPSFAATITEN